MRADAVANRERVLAAAAAAVLRDGPQVPMATIAAEAGVGVATLYRRYPTREALLAALTHRAFVLIRDNAVAAAARGGTAVEALSWFWDRVIERRDELVLPLHGGPPVLAAETAAVQSEVHGALGALIRRDSSIRSGVTTGDLVVFGAMLAQPLTGATDWERIARRQKDIFLRGLA
jgi:AcrR family transcriptional regulator